LALLFYLFNQLNYHAHNHTPNTTLHNCYLPYTVCTTEIRDTN